MSYSIAAENTDQSSAVSRDLSGFLFSWVKVDVGTLLYLVFTVLAPVDPYSHIRHQYCYKRVEPVKEAIGCVGKRRDSQGTRLEGSAAGPWD